MSGKKLLLVYHSQSGACLELAAAARQGVLQESGVELLWRRAWDAGMDDLREAGALMLVAAENSGSLAGGMKDFLDRTFYPAQEHSFTYPCSLVVSAGNDGRGARTQLERILKGYPMKLVAETLICRGPVNDEYLSQCRDMGLALAAGLAMGIF